MFIRLLTRSATGERITQYTSQFAKPRDGGEMHIVLVDNGRSARLADERFWPSLKCYGPVRRRTGIIMMPAADIRRWRRPSPNDQSAARWGEHEIAFVPTDYSIANFRPSGALDDEVD